MSDALLKKQRNNANLTQTEAANILGVSLRTWSRWESGDKKMPFVYFQYFLAKISGGAPSEFNASLLKNRSNLN